MVCGYLDADVRRIADDLLLAESAARPEPKIEARPGVRSGTRRRKQPRVEAWDEIVPDDEEAPEAEDPPEPEFAPAKGGRTGTRSAPRKAKLFERTDSGRKRSRRRKPASEQKTEETIAVGGFDWHRDDAADWGFDDDPADFSAAV
jgi:hypothetical protein